MGCGNGEPFPPRWVEGGTSNFHLKWRVLANAERYFLSVTSPESNVELSARSGNLMDVELLHHCEY